MITVVFREKNGKLYGFSASGHAGYGDYGNDIVCAAVTSAVQLTVNGLTEVKKISADVKTFENEIDFTASNPGESDAFLRALRLHLEILQEQYEGKIKTEIISEV